jgi:hypothetical protein
VVAVCTVARHEGSGSGAGAAADVGGVGGPVSGGCALPGGGDGDVDAELAEAFGQAAGADRTSGLSAWEQPGRGAVIADGRVAAPGGEELPDEAGGGLGEGDWFAAEAQLDVLAAGLDVAEAADDRWPLGVEEPRGARRRGLQDRGCRRGAGGGLVASILQDRRRACACTSCRPSARSHALRRAPSTAKPVFAATRQDAVLPMACSRSSR